MVMMKILTVKEYKILSTTCAFMQIILKNFLLFPFYYSSGNQTDTTL